MTKKRTSGLPLPLGEVLESGLDGAREERLWSKIRARRGMGGHSEPPKPGHYLPSPISEVLKSDDVAGDRSRLWREIDARRRGKHDIGRPAYALAFGVTTLAAALLLFWLGPAQNEPGDLAAGPLITRSGAAMVAVEASRSPQTVALADDSEVRLDRGARVEPLLSTATRFELLLAQGSAEFSVTPGGPRRWIVEAGLATVEVLGTVFRVTRNADSVDVSVSRGVVLVRSNALTGHVQRLVAGQSLHVTPQRELPSDSLVISEEEVKAHDEATEAETPTIVLAPIELEPQKPARTSAKWRHHLRHGRYRDAYAELGGRGLSRAISNADSIERLLELADVARLSGHPVEAVPALERALKLHARSPQAALAAFTLGRVLLDQLGRPGPAADAFEKAIEMRPPHALLADCHTRLVEAYARAGDTAAAERAASRYRTMFPAGRHATDLDRWTNE